MAQGHRVFASAWDRVIVPLEGKNDKRARERVVSGVRGRTLELGFGVGTNWKYLPEQTEYVGIEPDPYMLRRARRHAQKEGRVIELHQVRAEELPFDDDSFDTVFETLTFCTIADVRRALAQVQRVLRPGGEFRFWEHVRPTGKKTGKVFDVATPAWSKVGGGCQLNRDTEAAIRNAGFEIKELTRSKIGPMPFILGVAATQKQGEPSAAVTEDMPVGVTT